MFVLTIEAGIYLEFIELEFHVEHTGMYSSDRGALPQFLTKINPNQNMTPPHNLTFQQKDFLQGRSLRCQW